MSKKKPMNEVLGLSVEETTNRMMALGQLMRWHEKKFGEKLNLKHLEAVLHANTAPKSKEKNT